MSPSEIMRINGYGPHQSVISKHMGQLQRMVSVGLTGFLSQIERAGTRGSIAKLSSNLWQTMRNADIQIIPDQVNRAVNRTIILNPNLMIRNGKLCFSSPAHVSVLPVSSIDALYGHPYFAQVPFEIDERSRCVEDLVKALIGESMKYTAYDSNHFIHALRNANLFGDGQDFDESTVFLELEQLDGLQIGERGFDPSRSNINPTIHNFPLRRFGTPAYMRYFNEAFKQFPILQSPHSNSLELGCGNGFFASVAPQSILQSTIPTDWNKIATLLHNVTRNNCLTAQTANAYQLPYDDGRFTNIHAMQFCGAIRHLDKMLCEANRVLQDNGHVYLFQDADSPNDFGLTSRLYSRGLKRLGDNVFVNVNIKADLQASQFAAYRQTPFDIDNAHWLDFRAKLNTFALMQNAHEYIEAWQINELKFAGFDIEYARPDISFAVIDRDEFAASLPPETIMPDGNIFGGPPRFRGPYCSFNFAENDDAVQLQRELTTRNVLTQAIVWSVIARKYREY